MMLLVVNVITILTVFLLNKFLFFVPYNLKFIFGYLIFIIVVNLIISFSICVYEDNRKDKNKKKSRTYGYITLGILGALVLLLVFRFFTTGKMVNYKEYRKLAGEIKQEDFTEDIEIIDISELPINNSDLARNLADKKLGEIPSLGSQVEIGEFTLQKVNGELYYVAPLEHTGLFKWMNNKEGTEGYIKVNATRSNDVELITELDGQPVKLKYLKSAYFGSNIERYAYNQNNKYGLTDFSFELDDNGRPYSIVSIYDKEVGFSGNKIIGTLIIDVQTGETKEYSVEETPSWVDRIQPKNFIKKNLNNWGKLVHGTWNFSNKDKLKLTDGVKVIYSGDACYYYTGVTSVGSDESLVGFLLTNSRTGHTSMYKMSGAIESAAMSSAEGKLQQFGYEATWPVLINVQSQPTYFMTMLDNKGLIKNYAFVSVKNYNVLGTGESLEQAYNNYIEGLSKDTSSNLIDSSEFIELEGTIERIGMYISNSSSYYMIVIEGNENKFIVPTEVSNLVAIAEKGDKIKISYIPNTTEVITVKSFENKTK